MFLKNNEITLHIFTQIKGIHRPVGRQTTRFQKLIETSIFNNFEIQKDILGHNISLLKKVVSPTAI
jgi:hypothetical protein